MAKKKKGVGAFGAGVPDGEMHAAHREGMKPKAGPPRGRGQHPAMEHETDRIASSADVLAAHRGSAYGGGAGDTVRPSPKPTPAPPANAIENLKLKQQTLKDVMSW